jgi:hypothetical protein
VAAETRHSQFASRGRATLASACALCPPRRTRSTVIKGNTAPAPRAFEGRTTAASVSFKGSTMTASLSFTDSTMTASLSFTGSTMTSSLSFEDRTTTASVPFQDRTTTAERSRKVAVGFSPRKAQPTVLSRTRIGVAERHRNPVGSPTHEHRPARTAPHACALRKRPAA